MGDEDKRITRCESCGLTVFETFRATMHGPTWSLAEHAAPCGFPCIGGGVSGRLYRVGLFHRDAARCPECARKEARDGK